MDRRAPFGLPPESVPAWTAAFVAARKAGLVETDARELAGQALLAVRGAGRATSPACCPGEHAIVALADKAHGAACRVLRIKASPPSFNLTVSTLGDLMIQAFGAKAVPGIAAAVDDLAAIAELEKPAATKWQAAKARVASLEAQLASQGGLGENDAIRYGRLLTSAYRLGKEEVAAPLGFTGGFDVVDRDAIHGLQNAGLFWIGKHYGEALDSDTLREIVRTTMLEEGLGRGEAGKRLRDAFGSQIKRSDAYWRGLAAVVATRARSFGALESMHRAGARRYEYLNPLDEATSDVCRNLAGRTFTVSAGLELRDKLLTATTPEEWRTLAPWPKAADLLDDAGKAKWAAGGLRDQDGRMDPALAGPHVRKPAELAAAGIAWPPLHMHCRSTIEVRVWYPLEAEDLDPLGNVDPASYQPPKKKKKAKPVAVPPPEPVAPAPWKPSMPSWLRPAPPTDEAGWRAIWRTMGYTDAEIDALFAVEVQGAAEVGLPANLVQAIVKGDDDAILFILQAHPPATPLPWPPPSDLYLDAKTWAAWDEDAIGAWFQESAHPYAVAWRAGEIGEAHPFWFELPNKVGGAWTPDDVAHAEWVERLEAYRRKAAKGSTLDEALDAAKTAGGETDFPVKLPKPPPAVVEPPPAPAPIPVAEPVVVIPPSGPAVFEVPPVPAVTSGTAEAIGTGTAEWPAIFDWTPEAPKLAGVGDLQATATWRAYLAGLGYSDTEAGVLLGTAKAPGPLRKLIASTVAESADLGLDDDAIRAALQVRVPGLLATRAPARLATLDARPPAFLSPSEIGARLQRTAETWEDADLTGGTGGGVFRDLATGERYLVRFHADARQARQEAVAAALYRKLGIEVADVRVVEIEGKVGVASRAWTGWQRVSGADDLATTHGAELARAMPADAWLANWNVAGTSGTKIQRRAALLPDVGGGVLRTDNAGVFDFRATGAAKPFSATEVAELATFTDSTKAPIAAQVFGRAAQDRHLLLPMLDRIGGLTRDEIAAAVRVGGLDAGDADRLISALEGRARWLGERAGTLRTELRAEAAARLEAARQAAAAAAERAKLQAELAERIARGEFVPGQLVKGLDLPTVAGQVEALGPIPVQSDHGILRDQALRVRRYALERAGTVEHTGFEFSGIIDSTKFADVEAGIRSLATGAGVRPGTTFRSWPRAGMFRRGADSAGSVVARFDASAESAFLGGGLSVELPDVSIDFAGSSALTAMEGQIRIRVKTTNPAKAQAALARVARELGIEGIGEAPARLDERTMQVNKAAWNVQGKGYTAKNRGQVLSAAKAESELRKHGVDPSTVRTVAMGRRGYSTTVIEGRWTRYRQDNGVRFLYHEAKTGSDDAIRGMLGADGAGGGLLSTVERSANGVVLGGMSSSTDLSTGGATEVFTRLVSAENSQSGGGQSHWYGWGDFKPLIHPRTLDRVDWYHNNHDDYGRLNQAREAADDAIRALASRGTANSHEIMLRREVPRSDVLLFAVSSDAARDQALRLFREAGITTYHGFPVADMVVRMDSPGDFSRFKRDNPIHAFLAGWSDDLPASVEAGLDP